MRSLLERSLDLYKLKMSYRYGMLAFMLPGFLIPVFALANVAYSWQLAWGLTPGAPLGSETGSWQFFLCFLALTMISGIIGMALGTVIYAVALSALTPITFREALSGLFLSNYPSAWFR